MSQFTTGPAVKSLLHFIGKFTCRFTSPEASSGVKTSLGCSEVSPRHTEPKAAVFRTDHPRTTPGDGPHGWGGSAGKPRRLFQPPDVAYGGGKPLQRLLRPPPSALLSLHRPSCTPSMPAALPLRHRNHPPPCASRTARAGRRLHATHTHTPPHTPHTLPAPPPSPAAPARSLPHGGRRRRAPAVPRGPRPRGAPRRAGSSAAPWRRAAALGSPRRAGPGGGEGGGEGGGAAPPAGGCRAERGRPRPRERPPRAGLPWPPAPPGARRQQRLRHPGRRWRRWLRGQTGPLLRADGEALAFSANGWRRLRRF